MPISLFSVSVSPLVPCKEVLQYCLSRFCIYLLEYNIYLSFSDTSLCIISSRFIYLIRNDSNVFLFMAEQYFIVYMYHNFFIHSSVDGHLGCFHVLAIVNSAAMHSEIHVSFSILVSSEYMPRSKIAEWYGGFIPSFLRTLHTVFHAAAKSLQSYPTLCDPIDGSPPGSPSLGFSRQEHWSGLPFPSPMHESEKWKWSHSVVSDS